MDGVSRRTFLLASAALAAQSRKFLEAPPTDPVAFIQTLAQQALAILRNPDLSEAARENRFKVILDTDFDMPRIGRFVLGRYWRVASDKERQTFDKLFEEWVVRIYTVRLEKYRNGAVEVTAAHPQSPTSYVVSSHLIYASGAPPIPIDWYLHKTGHGDLKVVDAEIEGVSMALVERAEVAATIQRSGGSVTAVNRVLENKVRAQASTQRANTD